MVKEELIDFKNKQIIPYKPLEELLKKVRIRSLSGIVAVTLITKPYPCPGNCLYCPNIPNMPKSYLPDEPACMRALDNQFNPYKQMQARIKALQLNGHPTDKIELIILGGTWSYYPKNYQTWFIKKSFDGANNKTSKNLIEAQKINEKSHNRIIGLTIETRPDYINKQEVKRLRDLGVTRIELGVQSIYDDVLNYNNQESSREDIVQATKLLKNAGFKITYHMMPNLPGSNLKRDEEMFKELFSNPDFQPDQLKIYPCVV
ncbi:MAG: elongator complex protein 3 [Minisyncoccia bacterium]